MSNQKSAKKLRAQARAARKRAERSRVQRRPTNRSATGELDPVAEMDAELAQLVEASPVSQREISDEEEEHFLRQVLDVNARAVARNSGVQEREARLILEALVQAGTLALRSDLHLVPVKPEAAVAEGVMWSQAEDRQPFLV